MRVFGFLNGCYWMLLDNLEDVIKHMNPALLEDERTMNYVVNSLSVGMIIAINNSGGYHAGEKRDYTEKIYAKCGVFPTALDRVAVMRKELDEEISRLCKRVGMSREEVMNYKSNVAV